MPLMVKARRLPKTVTIFARTPVKKQYFFPLKRREAPRVRSGGQFLSEKKVLLPNARRSEFLMKNGGPKSAAIGLRP